MDTEGPQSETLEKDRPVSGKKEHVHFGLVDANETAETSVKASSNSVVDNGVLITEAGTFMF